jgi:DNA-directed RNA polymerase subunit M/transcription elongation factor TFIIS
MPVTIACPNCGAHLEAPDDIEGKKVQCKRCGERFRAHPVDEGEPPARGAAESARKSRSRPAVDDGDEDERPSRRTGKTSRGREDGDEDDRDRPRRHSRDDADEEGEPQAQKKKGKKTKKAGRPVVLLISIGVGVLLLIAGIGAYFSFFGDQQSDGAADGGPVSSGSGGAAGDPNLPGWVEFADPNGQFKVRMPRNPAAPTKQQWAVPNGDGVEATIYTVEIGGGQYAVAQLTMPGLAAAASADPVLDESIDGGVGWFKGAVIKSRTKITHQGFPGRQAVLEYPEVKGSTVLRVILAGNRMFWVVAKGDNFAADTPKVRGFLDSLKIN